MHRSCLIRFFCAVLVNSCLPINPAFVINGGRDVGRPSSAVAIAVWHKQRRDSIKSVVVETGGNVKRRTVRDADGNLSPQLVLPFSSTRRVPALTRC